MAYSWKTYRARIANLQKHGRAPDDPDLLEARRDLTAARLEHYAIEAVDMHPITDKQLARVLDILDRSNA